MRQRQATEAAPVTPTPELALAHGRAEPGTRVRNMHRFRVGVTILLSIGICSLVAAIVLSTHGRTSHQSGGWSVFSPQDDGLPGAQEIANYVAPYYRASPAQQLAVVTAL